MVLKNLELDQELKDLKWNKNENLADKMFSNNFYGEERKISIPERLRTLTKTKINNNYSSNYNMSGHRNKILPYTKVIKNVKNSKATFINNEEYDKWLVDFTKEKEFEPHQGLEQEIPLTFQKIFYGLVKESGKNINKMALSDMSKLQTLVENVKNQIAQNFAWFIDNQLAETICQLPNYSEKAIFRLKEEDWKNLEENIVNKIIFSATEMLYPSKNFNKDNKDTCIRQKGQLLLIINTLLYKKIENAGYKNQWEEPKSLLEKLVDEFPNIINFPLKNNFQFIIIDKNALVAWYKTERTEIKYDEDKSLTYFLDYMVGGIKQLTCLNAAAGVKS